MCVCVCVCAVTHRDRGHHRTIVLDLAHDAQSKIDSFGRRKYGGGWNVGLGRGGFKRKKNKSPAPSTTMLNTSVNDDTNDEIINSDMHEATLAAVARAGGAY